MSRCRGAGTIVDLVTVELGAAVREDARQLRVGLEAGREGGQSINDLVEPLAWTGRWTRTRFG